MIDLASSDNLLLRLNPEFGYANNEVLISISYSAMKGISQNIFFFNKIFFLYKELLLLVPIEEILHFGFILQIVVQQMWKNIGIFNDQKLFPLE